MDTPSAQSTEQKKEVLGIRRITPGDRGMVESELFLLVEPVLSSQCELPLLLRLKQDAAGDGVTLAKGAPVKGSRAQPACVCEWQATQQIVVASTAVKVVSPLLLLQTFPLGTTLVLVLLRQKGLTVVPQTVHLQ